MTQKYDWYLDSLSILRKTLRAVKEYDWGKLKDMSSQTIHSAVIFDEKLPKYTAILNYVLAKVIERYYTKKRDRLDILVKNVIKALEKIINLLENKRIEDAVNELEKIINHIDIFDQKESHYLRKVLDKAKLKVAYFMHRHGVSLRKLSEDFNIPINELLDYMGKTKVYEDIEEEVDEKIKDVEEFFE